MESWWLLYLPKNHSVLYQNSLSNYIWYTIHPTQYGSTLHWATGLEGVHFYATRTPKTPPGVYVDFVTLDIFWVRNKMQHWNWTPDSCTYDYISTFFPPWWLNTYGSWHTIVVWELSYKVDIGCFWQTQHVIQNEWCGNPRYVLLSRFQIWCYWVNTFPNLAVLPKMVLKS